MPKTIVRASVIGAVAAAMLALLPAAAFAVGNSRMCPAANWCAVKATGFPGGTISVDADSGGRGTANWVMYGPNGYKCSRSFPASQAIASWSCNNAPAGTYSATVTPGEPGQRLAIGIRW